MLIVFLNYSCENDPDYQLFTSLIQGINSDISIDNIHYLIIPLDGCGKCIDESFAFSKKNMQNKNIKFIISSLSGTKHIKYFYNTNYLNSSNLIIDSKGSFYKSGFLENGYVKIINIQKGKITKKVIPPENILKELSQLEYEINTIQ